MLEPGEKYAVDITVKPPWTSLLVGRVRLATGVPEQPEDEIDFVAHVSPRLTFTCEPPTVPRVRAETRTMKLWPKWSPDRPPGHIVAVESGAPGLHSRIVEEAGTVFVATEITTHCDAPPRGGYHTVTVRTDDPAAAEIKVPIRFAP
jgi:hypothetical protein